MYEKVNKKDYHVLISMYRPRTEKDQFGRKKSVCEEFLQTPSGTFPVNEWISLAEAAIKEDGMEDILAAVETYCKLHCLWLQTEKDIHRHALECTLSGAYKSWNMSLEVAKDEPGERPTFRMYARVRFDRPVRKSDALSTGSFEFIFGEDLVTFDFEEMTGSIDKEDPTIVEFEFRNLDYSTFPEAERLTKRMLSDVRKVNEFIVECDSSDDDESPQPEKLLQVAFVLPYDDFEQIDVNEDVCKNFNWM